jgi:hypothetical protein
MSFHAPAGDDLRSDLPWAEPGTPAHPVLAAIIAPGLAEQCRDHSMRGRLTTRADVRRFMEAGNATLTIVSRTGTRFTYKCGRPRTGSEYDAARAPVFVKVLTGPDNENDYQYLATIFRADGKYPEGELRYVHSRKSRVGPKAPSAQALEWLVGVLNLGITDRRADMPAACEVWHEGRCGRCGLKLTVPESVASGFGPDCRAAMGL